MDCKHTSTRPTELVRGYGLQTPKYNTNKIGQSTRLTRVVRRRNEIQTYKSITAVLKTGKDIRVGEENTSVSDSASVKHYAYVSHQLE